MPLATPLDFTPASLTITQVAQFERNGYVIVRGLIEPEVIEHVRDETQRIADEHIEALRAADKIEHTWPDEPFEVRLAKVYAHCAEDLPTTVFRPELHRPGYYPLFFHDRLLDMVEQLLGPEVRLYPNYSVRPKLPNSEATQVLWHQDAGYTQEMDRTGDIKEARMVNVWSPLVNATVANGCMQFIPGTHRSGVVPHERKNQYYLEITPDVLQPRLNEAINVEMAPGDVVLFSNLLFHCGLPNRSSGVRWSCDWRYQDATQPTFRKERGHLARSQARPDAVVADGEQWAELELA